MSSTRMRWVRIAAIGAASALLVTACGGGDDDDNNPPAASSSPTSTEPVTLKVSFWGKFGFEQLVNDYKQVAPNVTLQLDAGDYAKQHDALQKYLVTGSGAPDVAAIDEGYIVKFRNQYQKFENIQAYPGGAARKSDYPGWKWDAATTADGKNTIGLGTDVGGLAMCYRSDLFKKAGLPTNRDEVTALWPTWDDFINVGKQYVSKSGDKKKKFIDSATNIFNPVLTQQPVGYFDRSESLQMGGGPKTAWDTATKMVTEGISANLNAFTAEWNAAFKNGSFAVLACPAWMQGYIQEQAPNTKGKWDIAAIPGGGGNWGGSYLTVPAQGKHKAEAYAFINWVTQPEQAIKIFKSVGNLPSQSATWTNADLLNFKSPFFSDAPVGKIFTESASKLGEGQYLGKKNGDVRTAVEAVMTQVQQGKLTPEAGWTKAQSEAEKAAQ